MIHGGLVVMICELLVKSMDYSMMSVSLVQATIKDVLTLCIGKSTWLALHENRPPTQHQLQQAHQVKARLDFRRKVQRMGQRIRRHVYHRMVCKLFLHYKSLKLVYGELSFEKQTD